VTTGPAAEGPAHDHDPVLSTPGLPALVASWHRSAAHHASEILTDPLAYSLARLTQAIITEATCEIERLRSELDSYRGRQVLYCTSAQMPGLLPEITDVPPGTVVRATDTGEEVELARGGYWQPREDPA
jgi:hypothetical protein